MLVAAIGGTTATASGTAHACSCAVPDLAASLLAANVVVHGEQIDAVDVSPSEEQIDRRFLFRVDERYRGDTPEVIEVRVVTELGSCDDFVRDLWPVLLLDEPTAEGWYAYPACGAQPLVRDLAPFFDEVAPPTGRGPPASIAAVATSDHGLAVLDAEGLPIAYLPGPGTTVGLAMCPGGDSFLQLRRTGPGDAPVELAVWRTAGWEVVGTVPVDVIALDPALPYQSVPLACAAPDGLTSYIGWERGYDVVGNAVIPNESTFTVVAPGPDGYALVQGDVGVAVASPDPNAPLVQAEGVERFWSSSIEVLPDGWRITSVENRFPDPPQLVTRRVGLDGTVSAALTAEVAVDLFGWAATTIDPSVAAGLTITPGPAPTPLFERSGSLVDAPAPTLPVVASASSPTTAPSVVATEPAGAVDEALGDGGSPVWIVPAVFVLVGLPAGALVVLLRRRGSLER